MNFLPWNSHTGPLFRKNFILKFKDKIDLENTLFISKSINNLLPFLFIIWFIFSANTHIYNTSGSSNDKLQKYPYRANTYGKNSITVSATESWNNNQIYLKSILLTLLTPNKIRLRISNEYLKSNWAKTCHSFLIFFPSVWLLQIFRTCYLVFDFSLITALLLNLWFKNK